MKSCILFCLIFSIMLSMFSCSNHDVIDENPPFNGGEKSETDTQESESESESESSHVYVDFLEDKTVVHVFDINRSDRAYRDYLTQVMVKHIRRLPNFVHFEELLSVGDADNPYFLFESARIYDEPYFDVISYQYRFKANYEYSGVLQRMSLTVRHSEELEDSLRAPLPEQFFREENPIVLSNTGETLLFIEEKGNVDYVRNGTSSGIYYTYSNGRLYEISWQSGETSFWLTFDEPYSADWVDEDGNLEILSHPILEWFLNKDQTATAIAWFDAIITADEAQ